MTHTRLFIKARPNDYGTMMDLMEKGHQMVESGQIKDFEVVGNFRHDYVELYIIEEVK